MLAEELQVQRGLEIDLPAFDPDVRAAVVAGVDLEVSANVIAAQPTDQQLRAYYETHRARYVTEGTLRMRELVIRTDASTPSDQAMRAATQAVNALRAHEPLTQVAARYHLQDSGRLMQGGQPDTGEIPDFAAKAKLGPEVYQVAAALSDRQNSAAILQPDGAYVLVVFERKLPIQQVYDAVADRVWADYKSEAQQRVREANLRYLRERARILLSDDAKGLESPGR
jgi:hypothetical protein